MVMEKSYIEDAALPFDFLRVKRDGATSGFEEQPSGVLKQCG